MSVSAASNVDASGLLLLTVREAAERLDEPVRLYESGGGRNGGRLHLKADGVILTLSE